MKRISLVLAVMFLVFDYSWAEKKGKLRNRQGGKKCRERKEERTRKITDVSHVIVKYFFLGINFFANC